MAEALVTIAGYVVPTPSTYNGNTADLVDSARNASGLLIGAVVRHDVAKVELTWRYLTVEEWSTILKLFNPKYGGNFYNSVRFFNQVSGQWETRQMYVNDRTTSGGIFKLDANGMPVGWIGPKLALIEV